MTGQTSATEPGARPGRGLAAAHRRDHDLVEVGDAAHGMDVHAVRDLADHLAIHSWTPAT